MIQAAPETASPRPSIAKRLRRKLGMQRDTIHAASSRSAMATRDAVYDSVGRYTMTGPHRIAALCDAVDYVEEHQLPGDFVECGVWRGGSAMAMMTTLLNRGKPSRQIHLYDTFEGMSEPTDHDLDHQGNSADMLLKAEADDKCDSATWAYCSQADVEANLAQIGYPSERVHLVRGKVEDTLPAAAPQSISLLRLDTDWYESTRHEMVHLFPRLCVGGVLIIDDYGHWRGARKAVDEYLAENNIRLFLQKIDYTGVMAIKQAA